MPLITLAPAAFVAGILMFLAPCTLPLIPAYLVFIAGTSESDIAKADIPRATIRRRILQNAIAFILGFSVIFILLGVFSSFIGSLLGVWRYTLGVQVAGLLLILFGIMMLGLRVPLLAGEWHLRMPRFLQLGKPESAFLLGSLFALGWSPCIGPVLGSILFLAATTDTALQGAVLLGIFSLGLATPFFISALLIDRVGRSIEKLTRISSALYMVGGTLLIVLGVAMLTGTIGLLFEPLSGILSV